MLQLAEPRARAACVGLTREDVERRRGRRPHQVAAAPCALVALIVEHASRTHGRVVSPWACFCCSLCVREESETTRRRQRAARSYQNLLYSITNGELTPESPAWRYLILKT